MSISNILGFDGKLLPSVFPTVNPYPPLAPAGLGDVLQVNNSAATPFGAIPQSITNVATLGCADIVAPFGTIQSFNSSLIQSAGGLGHLGILPVNNLTLKGCQTKGSMLVGDGTSSKELIVPVAPALPNGSVLILDSNEALGVRWGGEAGDINSITPGNNIDITGPTANPIVALKAPLTSTLNMGAVAITDSAGAVGVSGQVLTAGTGGQTLWGTNGVSSITAGTNISITGTAAVPIVNLGTLGVLTSTLNAGIQNIQGTSTQFTLTNGGSQANATATLGFTSADASVATTKSVLFKTGLTCQTATNAVVVSPTSVVKSGTTAFAITSGSSQIVIQGLGGLADGIQLNQLSGQGTTLTTSLSNVKYYPDYYLSNNNSITQGVPAPQVVYQRLTLNNLGLTNTNTWTNYGNNVYTGYSAFTIDSGGNYWYAEQGSGNITVIDSTFNVVATLQLNYFGNPGDVYTFYSQGGYMFIGGRFDQVIDANGANATAQYSITRVNSSYLFDPMEDPSNSNRGFTPGSNVYSMTDVNGALVCGGTFTSNAINSIPINYIGSIANPYVPGSNQVWSEYGNGVNSPVFAIYHEAFLNYTFVGGDFTEVDINAVSLPYPYCAYYDNGVAVWSTVAGNNFTGGVRVIQPAPVSLLFIAGNFGQLAGSGQNYNTYIDPASPNIYTYTLLTLGSPVSYNQAFHSGGLLGVWDAASSAFQESSSTQSWTNLGDPTGSGTLTGINYSGSWRVIYSADTYVRQHGVLPHSCEFQGSFVYDNNPYTKYTIITRNVSQQFIGDITCSFWSIIGQLIGAFS